MKWDFLKPRWINSLITLAILALPVMSERVALPAGGFVVERYQPVVLIVMYTWMLELKPLILMLGYSLFIYLVVSTAVMLAMKVKEKYGKQ